MSAAAAVVGGEAPKKKSKLLLILIVVVVLLIVAVGGIGAFLVLGKKHSSEETAEAKPAVRKPPVFLPLDTFTVNLADSTRERYLQTNISLEIQDDKVGEEIKVYSPAIRNKVLILLSSQSGEMISTPDGKDALANAIVDQINLVLGYKAAKGEGHGEAEKPPVIAALFSSFVVQ
jgi:flagellar FliL protein